MTGRVQVDPQRAFAEIAEFNRTLAQGLSLLDKTRDRDVQIATTPKREVFRQDKTVLYHYEPMARRAVKGNSPIREALSRTHSEAGSESTGAGDQRPLANERKRLAELKKRVFGVALASE